MRPARQNLRLRKATVMRTLVNRAVALFAVLACGQAAFASEQYVINYSHLGRSDPMVQASGAKAVIFKYELEKLSKGRIKVLVYPNGQLGDQQSSIQQIRKGTIHIADISSGVLASMYYEPLEILDMPYIFSSKATARMVLDNNNPFTKKLIADCARKTGIRLLSLGPFGFRHMTNDVRPIKTPDDMKGLKMRVMSIVPHKKLMEAFGAAPEPVPWLELYTSLQTKVVDGEETTLQNIAMGKLYQVQKYLTATGHLMGVGAFLCNEQWYQSLPDDLRLAVVEAEKVSRLTYDGFGELLDALALEELKSKMQVYIPTPQETEMFRQAALPYLRRWMEQKHGPELVADFFAAVEAAESELKRQVESTITKHSQ